LVASNLARSQDALLAAESPNGRHLSGPDTKPVRSKPSADEKTLMLNLMLVSVGIGLNVLAQVALKLSAASLAGLSLRQTAMSLPSVLLHPWFICGVLLYAASVVNWVVVLARMDLSVAYPLMSFGYILALLIAVLYFREPVSAMKVCGVLVILVGIFLITRPIPNHV
jgi:multidrug transporter EmrE-like cation transporter